MREALNLDYSLLIPEYLLGALALAIIGVDMFMPKVRKDMLPWIAAAGLVVAFLVSLAWVDTEDNFAGLVERVLLLFKLLNVCARNRLRR